MNANWDNNTGTKDVTWWAATVDTAQGYSTEYKFLLSEVDTVDGPGSAPLGTGQTFGFNALANDDDNGGDREDQVSLHGGDANNTLYRSQNHWMPAVLVPEFGGLGGPITANVYSPFIDAGTEVILTALGTSGHQWYKDGAPISGANNKKLVLEVTEADAGVYHADYDDGTGIIASGDFLLTVQPAGSIPVAAPLGLAATVIALGLLGARTRRP